MIINKLHQNNDAHLDINSVQVFFAIYLFISLLLQLFRNLFYYYYLCIYALEFSSPEVTHII